MYADTRPRWPVLMAVCLGLFIVQVDTTALNLALPRVGRSLHVGIGALQWITDLYNLTYASFLLTGGLLGDRLGRKRVFASGLALFVVGSTLCAFARSLSVLLAGRLIQGVGAAFEIPGTLAILAATYVDPAERSRAMGVWASVSGLALAFGPSAGGWLVAHAGWPSIFLLNLPTGGAALLLTIARVEETPRATGRRTDLPGQLLAVALLASLTYALIESPQGGLAAPLARASLVVAPVCLCLFLLREARAADPMIPLGLFRSATFSGAAAAAATMTFAMYGLLFLLGLYLESIVGMSSFLAGLAILPSSIAFILTSPVAARLTRRIGPGPLMAGGLLAIAAGLLLLAGLTVHAEAVRLLVALSLTGFGMGLNTGPAVTVAVSSIEQRQAGIASGIINLARMIGATLGVAVLGAIVADRTSRWAPGGLLAAHGLAAVGPGQPFRSGYSAAFVAGMRASFDAGAAVALCGAAIAAATLFRLAASRRLPPGTSGPVR